jgi:hypothetical protein
MGCRLILRRWSSISQLSYRLGSTKQSVFKKAANATVQLWRNRVYMQDRKCDGEIFYKGYRSLRCQRNADLAPETL